MGDTQTKAKAAKAEADEADEAFTVPVSPVKEHADPSQGITVAGQDGAGGDIETYPGAESEAERKFRETL